MNSCTSVEVKGQSIGLVTAMVDGESQLSKEVVDGESQLSKEGVGNIWLTH